MAFLMQVLSESVGKALQLTGGPDAQETARFVLMFDKFFDALNVGDFKSSKHHRKPFQAPYVSNDDFRLDVSVTCTIYIYTHCNTMSYIFSILAY